MVTPFRFTIVVSLCIVSLLMSACGTTAPPTATPAKPAAPKPTEPSKPATERPADAAKAEATKPAAAPTSAPAPAKPTAAPSPVADKPLDPPANVKVGVVASMSDSGIFLAFEKGYFKEQGLNVEIVNFDSAARMVAPLAAGQIDIGAGSPSAGLYNAIARDIPARIVADKGSLPKGFGFQAMSVRKDLIDSGQVKTAADLKGRTLALNAKGTSTELYMDKVLEKGGLTLKDVEVVELPFPDINSALANKRIDAGVYIEPNVARGVDMGVAVRYWPGDEVYPNMQVATILYGPTFIKNSPEAAKRWMVGYVKGVRYYNDAFAKKDPKVREEVIPLLIKHTPVKEPKLYEQAAPPGLNPDGYVNAKGIVDDFNWYVKQGLITEPDKVGINSVVDNSFADYAMQKLGKYK